jgi:hypothetical protein
MYDSLIGQPNYFSTSFFWFTVVIAIIVAYKGVNYANKSNKRTR